MGLTCFVVGLISMVSDPLPLGRPFSVFLELMIYGTGYLTGIIANAQPVIFVPEANKTTQFIKLCNQASIPIVYLHNVTGFMVGAKTEAQGLIKAGAQLVNAVSNSKVSTPPPTDTHTHRTPSPPSQVDDADANE